MTFLRPKETSNDGGSGPGSDLGLGPIETHLPLKILLADDEAVNQQLVTRMLRGMGHEVSVVDKGREVVEAWESGDFDLILMDVQMPGMDGLEALAEIRGREASRKDLAPIPILALTAQAMMGDRERCLDAGFDDYLSKSLCPDELNRAFEKWSDPSRRPATPAPAPAIEEADEPFDREKALANLGGDEDLFLEILELFLNDCPRLLAELEVAVGRSDGPATKRLAHTIRGVAGHFSLTRAIESAAALEGFATTGDWPKARQGILTLRLNLDRLFPTLEAVLSTSLSNSERTREDARNGTVDAINR